MTRVSLVLGDQLFADTRHLAPRVLMVEAPDWCSRRRFHSHKLVLVLAAMRQYADLLRARGHAVTYVDLAAGQRFSQALTGFLRDHRATHLAMAEVTNHAAAASIRGTCNAASVTFTEGPNPGFLTSRDAFRSWLDNCRGGPKMQHFYTHQRRTSGILMTPSGEPAGGRFSFDEANRKPLPKGATAPDLPGRRLNDTERDVVTLVARQFPDHAGDPQDFWLPTNHGVARAWLDDFLDSRLAHFGAYQDALHDSHPTLFHALLSPMLNLGLLTPGQVLDAVLRHADEHEVPSNSLEGFVRQVLGWREFVRGIHDNFRAEEHRGNALDNHRRLGDAWYTGSTGLPPLDDAIRKAAATGYNHHIERLMVVGNSMLLCDLHPHEVHRWFMELFVDSATWVMGPNVYGMSQFSDGGLFATKPYTCASNYWLKMGNYSRGEWCDTLDGLYWRFVARHREQLRRNHRMGLVVKNLERMDSSRRQRLVGLADAFISRVTREAPSPDSTQA